MHLIKKDEKVGASEATLLTMLKILPFSYGLVIEQGKTLFYKYNLWLLSPITNLSYIAPIFLLTVLQEVTSFR